MQVAIARCSPTHDVGTGSRGPEVFGPSVLLAPREGLSLRSRKISGIKARTCDTTQRKVPEPRTPGAPHPRLPAPAPVGTHLPFPPGDRALPGLGISLDFPRPCLAQRLPSPLLSPAGISCPVFSVSWDTSVARTVQWAGLCARPDAPGVLQAPLSPPSRALPRPLTSTLYHFPVKEAKGDLFCL